MDARFTGPQIAELSNIPYPTLATLVAREVAVPSIQRGEGSGSASLWSFSDGVALASFGVVRPSPKSLALLRKLYEFWHSPEGEELIGHAWAHLGHRGPDEREPTALVLISAKGDVFAEREVEVRALSKKHGPRLYIIDVDALVTDVLVEATTKRMVAEHLEPLRSGRVPRPSGRRLNHPLR